MTDSNPDFVVVGGGAAGAIVAARLSEDPSATVVLLEAGGDERRPDVQTPEAWPTMLGSDADWAAETVPQSVLGRTVPAPRGRILGGSGSINVMAHLRGHRDDYDRWAQLGADGWGWDAMLPFHKLTEDVPDGDPAFRGRGGPLRPRPIVDPHPLSIAHVEAAVHAGLPRAADLNDGDLRGAALHDLLIDSGHRRQSSATAYLRPAMDRPNLTVVTGAQAASLVFDGTRCVGVDYLVDGVGHTVRAGRETVLSAGAVATARLLLGSGIGPVADLEKLGIEVVAESDEVGANLQDHILLAGVRVRTDVALPPPSGNFAESTLFTTLDGGPGRPDLQICNVQVDYHTAAQEPAGQAFTFGIGLMRPQARGTIRLASADPFAPPLIDPRYLSERADVDAAVAGVELADRLFATGAFSAWGGRCDASDWLARDRAGLESLIADGVSSFFHLSGTARMGSDDAAVVGPDLKVRGVDGVRVADASVFPEVVSCNTQAAAMAVGEKVAALILGRC
ncbi:choline dehydrogenase [Gordonia spumicola]|uniref:Choline dehydrogenase n=1 Tax=Gordonia spumicola TaxID=589161 RepID=A0A7I9V8K7_9ACTN|nr:GMC family oxidoreductase N-terminal domain-containing protein [Gordonia spumicola]GEE01657.1 choline dehydrogenase [Gordonia spumicola]